MAIATSPVTAQDNARLAVPRDLGDDGGSKFAKLIRSEGNMYDCTACDVCGICTVLSCN